MWQPRPTPRRCPRSCSCRRQGARAGSAVVAGHRTASNAPWWRLAARSLLRLIRCAMPLRPIYCKQAMTSAPCRICSAMQTSRRRWSTHMSSRSAAAASVAHWTLWCQPPTSGLPSLSANGRWLVSASGGFLEPQLGLRPASRAVNLRPIPNALACYSLPAPSLPRLSPR